MRVLSFSLAIFIALLQYPLWLGKGSWLKVAELDRHVAAQRATNAKLKARNEALDAEVRDLKQGTEAIEERARMDLGMIKKDEVFHQVVAALPPTR
jgi:cell division protein FtsB